MTFFDRVLPLEEPPVRVAHEDPELFYGLHRSARREAQLQAVAPALRLDPGAWDACVPGLGDPRDHVGLLIVNGLLIRTTTLGRRTHSEVIGPGDVIRPWEQADEPSTPYETTWMVVESARIAVLNPAFLKWACRWPTVMAAIVGRAMRRSQSLALQLAITDTRRVDERLLLLFWHLADRWGRVRPDGVHVPLRVTHDVLAQLVGAQRPTVTTALQKLIRAGQLDRLSDKTWVLTPAATRTPTAIGAQAAAGLSAVGAAT